MVDTQTAPQEAPAEAARLAVLRSYGILDTPAEESFDDLTGLAAHICDVPIALVSLVEDDRQWFKATLGLEVCSTSREVSFCAHALGLDDILEIPDAREDPRFADNPLVTGEPHIRFYAGAPLVNEDGFALGTLCVIDRVPRRLTDIQRHQLKALARQVVGQLTLRRQTAELAAEIAARRDSQAELEKREGLLHGIISATDALVYAKDLDGRFILANDGLSAIVGTDLMGLSDEDLFPAEVAEAYRRNDLAMIAGGHRQLFEESLAHPDGSIHQYLSAKFPVRGADGRIYAMGGVSTDVTVLAEERRELAEGRQRWRALVEKSPISLTVVDAHGRFRYANPRARELFCGTPDGTVVGRAWIDFVVLHDRPMVIELHRRALDGRPTPEAKWQLLRADGTVITVEVSAVPVDYEGQPCLQIELRDTTEREAVETARREYERRWHALFAGSPVGIALVDDNHQILSANAALCDLIGLPEADVVGRVSTSLAEQIDFTAEVDVTALLDGSIDGVVRTETSLHRPDGEQRWAFMTLARLVSPSGAPWTLVHLEDITDRKADQQVIADSEADLKAVARVVQQIQMGEDARQTIVDACKELSKGRFVSLVEPSSSRLSLQVSATTDPRFLHQKVPFDATSVTVEVFSTGESVLIADPSDNPRISQALLSMTEAQSFYFVPVSSGENITGVLVVAWDRPIADLSDRHAAAVRLLADHAGVALRQSELMAELESMALTDPLTGIPNRRSWDQLLGVHMRLSERNDKPLTVALADLDHFKRYNDTNGHPAGDGLLREFADASRQAVRGGDIVARWGGEEFAFALPNCSGKEAERVLDRVRQAVPQLQTCSIGYATWDGVESASQLLSRADAALYEVKRTGRNAIAGATLLR